jgi:ABC-2 type transport system permease protein
MNTLTIFRREVGQYFSTPFAYLIAAAVLMFTGLLFNQNLSGAAQRAVPVDPAFIPSVLSFTMVFFAPLLTMRLLAEERREGTMELLLTSPVDEGSIVAGKFLGAWFYYSVLLVLTFVYQLALLTISQPDLGHTLCAYIGIWLYGGATMAVGILFSALTENQIVAAFLSMIALLLMWLGDSVGQLITNIDVARVIRTLTLQGHYSSSFNAGLLRAEDVAFFAGIIMVLLFLTMRIVASSRWR